MYYLKDHPLNQSYLKLPKDFYQKISPKTVSKPQLLMFNNSLANSLNIKLDIKQLTSTTNILAGNTLADNCQPIAQAYAGHQFGYYSKQLGDGRAVLLGEVSNLKKAIFDLQLKGSGITKYSRQGDGKAPLAAVIREYIISEAMNSLNIPTTRSLAITITNDNILRSQGMVPSAVLARIASSHLRIGTFEYAARLKNKKHLIELADFTISRHYPEIKNTKNPYQDLLNIVCQRQAKLIAKWMQVGFIHGVMNTDNMSICGETIDYGPCAFIDDFNFDKVFSSIDIHKRYAYSNQANIGKWNLTRFAETLLPLLNIEKDQAIKIAENILESYLLTFKQEYWQAMVSKIGFEFADTNNIELVKQLLAQMQTNKADFTLSFRRLGDSLLNQKSLEKFLLMFNNSNNMKKWHKKWLSSLNTNNSLNISKKMHAINPLYIPRNHLVQHVIDQIIISNNISELQELLNAVTNPFSENKNLNKYSTPPKADEVVHQTFCGT